MKDYKTDGDNKLNPTICTMFEDQKWSFNKDGSLNFVSMELDAKSYDVLAQAGIGDRILLKKTGKVSSQGNAVAFLELVKKRGPKTQGNNKNAAKADKAEEI
jgi:hypothetical protein